MTKVYAVFTYQNTLDAVFSSRESAQAYKDHMGRWFIREMEVDEHLHLVTNKQKVYTAIVRAVTVPNCSEREFLHVTDVRVARTVEKSGVQYTNTKKAHTVYYWVGVASSADEARSLALQGVSVVHESREAQ